MLLNPDGIPSRLRTLNQWICWRFEIRDGKQTKVPINPMTGGYASTTDPTTWASFPQALAAAQRYEGLGFVFTADDPYCGIDLDGCRDANSGDLQPWARVCLESFDTYAEVSPSGYGVKLFGLGWLHEDAWHKVNLKNAPSYGPRAAAIEVYDRARFFAVTGVWVDGTNPDVVIVQEALETLQASYTRPKPTVNGMRPHTPLDIDDAELLERARNAENGLLFRRLYDHGDTSGHNEDDSAADMALCNLLAFWCGPDEARIDRLFRSSALMRPKWERADYSRGTIGKALAGRTEFYAPAMETAEVRPAVRVGVNGAHRPDPFVASVASVAYRTSCATPPEDLEPEALHGLLGEIVQVIAPHTESHPVTLLGSLIISIGCMLGRERYVYRDGARHAGNENACVVGLSGVSRKGTGSRRANEIIDSVCNSYNSNTTKNVFHVMREPVSKLYGLGSGEALVASLCEEQEKNSQADVRRLIYEEEFSRCLKAMGREGSTLSENLRQAWDGGVLASRTKGKRLEAKLSHVSVLGHITDVELKQELSRASLFNGFANRFLWLCTRRVRKLPFGGGDPPTASLVLRLRDTLEFCETVGRMEFDDETRLLWDQGGIYELLTERPKGLLGAVTSRAEAHVTRLALIYALMDADREIRSSHLLAALAVWDYSEKSAAYIFGSSTGDDYADQIDELLCEVYPGGLTRTEIRNHYGRHGAPGRIEAGLRLLEKEGRAEPRKMKTAGRSAEIWQAKSIVLSDRSDKSDKSPLVRARELVT